MDGRCDRLSEPVVSFRSSQREGISMSEEDNARPRLGRGEVDAAPQAPRLVIRGESFTPSTTHPYAAITDYLTVTFPFPLGEPGISPFFIGLCSAIGVGLGMLRER